MDAVEARSKARFCPVDQADGRRSDPSRQREAVQAAVDQADDDICRTCALHIHNEDAVQSGAETLCPLPFVSDPIAQHADAFDLNLDNITRCQVAGRIKPRASPCRGTRHDDIPRLQRHEG